MRNSHAETFATRVSTLRNNMGLSQTDLAKAVGVSTTCIWNWEEGNTHPRPRNLTFLAKALRTSREYLEVGGLESSEPFTDENLRLLAGARPKDGALSETIERARETIAELAGLPVSQVRVVLDYGG